VSESRRRRAKERLRGGRPRESGAERVTIERVTEPDGARVWKVSDEGGEFACAGLIADALHYASDLLHGPATAPRGTAWNLLRSAELFAHERTLTGEPPTVS
jgi:hypothetical protein